MQNVVLTQLSIPELEQLFHETLDRYFADKQIAVASPKPDEIGGIELAVEITGKAKPTIYNYCSDNLIPHSKRGKKLYFSRNELTDWLKSGKRKTRAEIALEAENFSPTNSRQPKTTVAAR
jgi:predicted DNA-binding transcriptional regulator AlpA